MLEFKKIAITGVIGSGKTTVSNLFKKKGAFVVNADEITHNLLATDKEIKNKLISLLGPEILDNQVLNRKKIAKKVFTNFKKLRALEQILHPRIIEEIETLYRSNKRLFVVDIPLLFKMGHQNFYDIIISITAKKEICQKRFINKGFTKEDFEARWNKQQSQDVADFVIENNGSIQELEKKLDRIVENFKRS